MMSETASPEQIQMWTGMAQNADEGRIEDVLVMDIYNIALPRGMESDLYSSEIDCLSQSSRSVRFKPG